MQAENKREPTKMWKWKERPHKNQKCRCCISMFGLGTAPQRGPVAGFVGGECVCMHASIGINLGFGFILLFVDSDICILAFFFFLSFKLLELAEENK